MYRLPHETTYTIMRQCDGEAEILPSYADLNGRTGFVFSPFMMSEKHPLLLIRPDETETCKIDDCSKHKSLAFSNRDIDKEHRQYKTDFIKFHSQICKGTFRKIVLARNSVENACEDITPELIFKRACRIYPNEFIALVSTPYSGTWLMATPETLVEGHEEEWHTVALAGTRRIGIVGESEVQKMQNRNIYDVWDEKNIHEQQYVADYIRERLRRFTPKVDEAKPQTLVAGQLIHIVTHFRFNLNANAGIGNLIKTLHPTPAVCGLPKEEAYKFILDNESGDRGYYSGFSGPLNYEGSTHLFVTLRCMQIEGRCCKLYAGGGLLSESEVETEWLETEAKMDTMRRCLAIRRI